MARRRAKANTRASNTTRRFTSSNKSRANASNTTRKSSSSKANAADDPLPARPSESPGLPVSGSEDVYSNATYGLRRGKGNNNCYAWAIDDYKNSGGQKLQPGNLSGAAGDMNLSSCAALAARAAADLKGRSYRVSPEVACRRGYYKVMAFLAKGTDYHWYKQHQHALVRWPTDGRWKSVADMAKALGVPPANVYAPRDPPRPGDAVIVRNAGLWSHKQGFATGPVLRDACDRAITDPRKACRSYGHGLDYKDFCGAMCVKHRASPR